MGLPVVTKSPESKQISKSIVQNLDKIKIEICLIDYLAFFMDYNIIARCFLLAEAGKEIQKG